MEFRFTEDETEILSYARESIRGRFSVTRFDSGGQSLSAWAGLGEDGWLHACLGDGDGDGDGAGAGMDLPVLAGIAREAGAVVAGEEFVHNAWLLPQLCSLIDDEDERGAWLAEQKRTPGFLTPSAALPSDETPNGLVAGAMAGFDRYALVGAPGQWRLERRRGGEFERRPLAGLSITVTGLEVRGGVTSSVSVALTETVAADLVIAAGILRSAALVGLAAEIVQRTVAYVTERVQFGKPIGQFQAVKHICADVFVETEIAWLAVLFAAVRGRQEPGAASEARLQAATCALSAARAGAQLHGGMGFTWESELHWFLKAALEGQLTGLTSAAAALKLGTALLENA